MKSISNILSLILVIAGMNELKDLGHQIILVTVCDWIFQLFYIASWSCLSVFNSMNVM